MLVISISDEIIIDEKEVKLIEDEIPDEHMLEAIEKEGFDLVFLGCERYHLKLKRILSDKIPDKVLNKAPADILIVR